MCPGLIEDHEEADEYENELHGLSNSNLHMEERRNLTIEI